MSYPRRGGGGGPRPPPPDGICPHFLKGRCSFGTSCRFSHDAAAPSTRYVTGGAHGGSGAAAAPAKASDFCLHHLRGSCTRPSCQYSHSIAKLSTRPFPDGLNHATMAAPYVVIGTGKKVEVVDSSLAPKAGFEVPEAPISFVHCNGSLLFVAFSGPCPGEGVPVGYIRCFDVTSGASLDLFCNGRYAHADMVTCMVSVPTPTTPTPILFSSSLDCKIRMWGMGADGKWMCQALPEGHIRGVTALACAPKLGRLLSGGSDNSIRVWDMASQAQVACFGPDVAHASPLAGLELLQQSEEVWSLVSVSFDGTVLVWTLAAAGLAPVAAFRRAPEDTSAGVTCLGCLPLVASPTAVVPLTILCGLEDGSVIVYRMSEGVVSRLGALPAEFVAKMSVVTVLPLPPSMFAAFGLDGTMSVWQLS